MASISSTKSSSGLGNTGLGGFGGLVSGIDRDALIEQLTAATQKKITKAEKNTQMLEWKQEALQNISDKLIDIQDEYLSYSSAKSVKNASFYESNVVSTEGAETATKYVKASGASEMTKYIRVKAVTQTASSASIVSGAKGGSTAIGTKIDGVSLVREVATSSNLAGKALRFGSYEYGTQRFHEGASFTFPTSYTTEENGSSVTHGIDYTTDDKAKLVSEINAALTEEPVYLDEEHKVKLKFSYHQSGNKDYISISPEGGNSSYKLEEGQENIFKALGFTDTFEHSKGADGKDNSQRGISIEDFNQNTSTFVSGKAEDGSLLHEGQSFSETAGSKKTMLDLLSGQSFSITYNGVSKSVQMLTKEEKDALSASVNGNPALTTEEAKGEAALAGLMEKFQSHIYAAFGSGKVQVSKDSSGNLQIANADPKDTKTLSFDAGDALIRSNIGIMKNQSNKLTLSGSLWENREKLFGAGVSEANGWNTEADLSEALAGFKINGKEISGISAGTTVSEMISKINQSDAGVKSGYLEGSGKLMLISTETGSGRSISLGDADNAADAVDLIFGGSGSIQQDGRDAELIYDYGNGINETITSSSNTFHIDGLKVAVSGEFGVQTDSEGNKLTDAAGAYKLDSSKTVSFTASANTEKVTESVKKFIESYNEVVKAVNEQVTTRPDTSYEPLTDAQKEEMSEKSIENWENKAKAGILYNESSVRNMSTDLQTVMSSMMGELKKAGLSYQDMENIGITMSSDVYDGGKLEFDEEKFKAAMNTQPETVSKIMAGTEKSRGLSHIIETVSTKYATRYSSRNHGSYGQLIEAGGSGRVSSSKLKNAVYKALKDNAEQIEKLRSLLKTEQKRYISQFTAMETAINNMNSQAMYLGGLSG